MIGTRPKLSKLNDPCNRRPGHIVMRGRLDTLFSSKKLEAPGFVDGNGDVCRCCDAGSGPEPAKGRKFRVSMGLN